MKPMEINRLIMCTYTYTFIYLNVLFHLNINQKKKESERKKNEALDCSIVMSYFDYIFHIKCSRSISVCQSDVFDAVEYQYVFE